MDIVSHREVMRLWPSLVVLAGDVGASVNVVKAWSHRGAIPGRWFAKVAQAARARGLDVDEALLARLAVPAPRGPP